MSVGVEFADQGIAVFFRGRREVGDKGLDQLAAGAAEGRGAAEVRGIGFHEIGIEVVLADQKAELIAEPRLAVAISVGGMPVRRRGNRGGSRRTRERTQLLDRAKADPVGLAQGAVDGASFGDAQLGAMHHGRNVGGIGIAVADKALRESTLINHRFEDPPTRCEVGELVLEHRVDSTATSPGSKLQEPGVGHIPSTIQQLKIARSYGQRNLPVSSFRVPSETTRQPTPRLRAIFG